jgi:hypothetical protein
VLGRSRVRARKRGLRGGGSREGRGRAVGRVIMMKKKKQVIDILYTTIILIDNYITNLKYWPKGKSNSRPI